MPRVFRGRGIGKGGKGFLVAFGCPSLFTAKGGQNTNILMIKHYYRFVKYNIVQLNAD